MTPKIPSPHNHIGMPKSDRNRDAACKNGHHETQKTASQDKALAYATELASRHAELMKRLA